MIHHPHDEQAPAAVLEEVAHGRSEARPCPAVAEAPPELTEVAHAHRRVDRAAKRAADEGRRRFRRKVDRLVDIRDFRNLEATFPCI
jgi:hypothetical protein